MISFQRGNDNERYLNFKMLIIIGMNFTALNYYFRFNQFILKSIFLEQKHSKKKDQKKFFLTCKFEQKSRKNGIF